MPKTMLDLLKLATTDLLYVTEMDAPFEAFAWPDAGELTDKKLLQLAHEKPKSPVEHWEFEEFFAEPTADADWHEAGEKAAVRRYRKLQKLLKDQLADIRIVRVGKKSFRLYLVGKHAKEGWVGLKSEGLET
jgi:Nuclease A inhibitor-like protein